MRSMVNMARTRRLEHKTRLLNLLRDWRDDGKITRSDYKQAQRAMGAYNPRKGRTYEEIYGFRKADEMKEKAHARYKKLSEFERTKTLSILRVLYKKPRFIRNIREEVGGSYSTIIKRVDFLQKEGYVTTRTRSQHPHRRTVTLTEKGEQFARAYVSATRTLPDEI